MKSGETDIDESVSSETFDVGQDAMRWGVLFGIPCPTRHLIYGKGTREASGSQEGVMPEEKETMATMSWMEQK